MADKTVNSPEEIIARNVDQIKEKINRIENYYNRFIYDDNLLIGNDTNIHSVMAKKIIKTDEQQEQ